MSNVCCIPTVSDTNYDSGLTVAGIPMDQYFCWVSAVESRISQVVGVIDLQSESCSGVGAGVNKKL